MTLPVDPVVAEQALLDLRNEPPPSDPTGAGCTLAIVLMVGLVLGMPVMGRATTMSNEWVVGISAAGGLAALISGVFGVLAGRDPRLKLEDVCRTAAAELNAAAASGEDRSQEWMASRAVKILEYAGVDRPDGTAWGMTSDHILAELGGAGDYVLAVERSLVERGLIDPVLTEISSG